MPAYEKCPAAVCGSCRHFRRHYIRLEKEEFRPLAYGHCVFPRCKPRTETQHCLLWEARADSA